MRRPLLIAGVAGTCFVLSALVGVYIGARFFSRPAGPAAPPVLGQAPRYQGLTNQLGQRVDSSQFDGKLRVVTFLFPYCTSYCPMIAAHLVGFEHILESAGLRDQVQLVAFDVDPAGTGPQQLRSFQREYGWDPQDLHWQFLTGKPDAIRRVVTGGYHIAYRKVSDEETESQKAAAARQTPQLSVVNHLSEKANVDYDVTHNDGLVIVDGQGRVRVIHDQADTLSGRELYREVQALLQASP